MAEIDNLGELFKAVQIIAQDVTNQLNFDKTVIARISSQDEYNPFVYTLTDSLTSFRVVDDLSDRKIGTKVYAVIPGGDYSKAYISKNYCLAEKDDSYQTAMDSYVSLTGDLINNNSFGGALTANGPVREIHLVSAANLAKSLEYGMTAVIAKFQTFLDGCLSGNYGIKIKIVSADGQIFNCVLDTEDMCGDVYNFGEPFLQEACFRLDKTTKIESITLSLFQTPPLEMYSNDNQLINMPAGVSLVEPFVTEEGLVNCEKILTNASNGILIPDYIPDQGPFYCHFIEVDKYLYFESKRILNSFIRQSWLDRLDLGAFEIYRFNAGYKNDIIVSNIQTSLGLDNSDFSGNDIIQLYTYDSDEYHTFWNEDQNKKSLLVKWYHPNEETHNYKVYDTYTDINTDNENIQSGKPDFIWKYRNDDKTWNNVPGLFQQSFDSLKQSGNSYLLENAISREKEEIQLSYSIDSDIYKEKIEYLDQIRENFEKNEKESFEMDFIKSLKVNNSLNWNVYPNQKTKKVDYKVSLVYPTQDYIDTLKDDDDEYCDARAELLSYYNEGNAFIETYTKMEELKEAYNYSKSKSPIDISQKKNELDQAETSRTQLIREIAKFNENLKSIENIYESYHLSYIRKKEEYNNIIDTYRKSIYDEIQSYKNNIGIYYDNYKNTDNFILYLENCSSRIYEDGSQDRDLFVAYVLDLCTTEDGIKKFEQTNLPNICKEVYRLQDELNKPLDETEYSLENFFLGKGQFTRFSFQKIQVGSSYSPYDYYNNSNNFVIFYNGKNGYTGNKEEITTTDYSGSSLYLINQDKEQDYNWYDIDTILSSKIIDTVYVLDGEEQLEIPFEICWNTSGLTGFNNYLKIKKEYDDIIISALNSNAYMVDYQYYQNLLSNYRKAKSKAEQDLAEVKSNIKELKTLIRIMNTLTNPSRYGTAIMLQGNGKEYAGSPKKQVQVYYEDYLQQFSELKVSYQESFDNYQNQNAKYLNMIKSCDSNILTFTNQDDITDVLMEEEIAASAQIVCDPDESNGLFNMYGLDNRVNSDEACNKDRYCDIDFGNSNATAKDYIKYVSWKIPLVNTMIVLPEITQNATTQISYYNSEGRPTSNRGDASYVIIRKASEGDSYAIPIRIAEYLNDFATNNTLTCTLGMSAQEIILTKDLIFGNHTANGTNYTFYLRLKERFVTSSQSNGYKIVPTLLDIKGKPVDIQEITYSVKKAYDVNAPEDSKEKTASKNEGEYGLSLSNASGYCSNMSVDGSGYYGIVTAQVTIQEKTSIDVENASSEDKEEVSTETKEITLDTFLGIPYKASNEIIFTEIPDRIVYNDRGTSPEYVSKCTLKDNKGKAISGITWTIHVLKDKTLPLEGEDKMEKDEFGNQVPIPQKDEKGNEIKDAQGNSIPEKYTAEDIQEIEKRYKSYYPYFKEGTNELKVPFMYYKGLRYCWIVAKKGNEVIFTCPINIYQQRYSYDLLNKWNGNLTIDEKNGTILSAMMGAGKKNSDNSFTGVLMGELQKAGPSKKDERIGLFGIHKGVENFSLTTEGILTLGSDGYGKIIMDGNSSELLSGNFMNFARAYAVDAYNKANPGKEISAYDELSSQQKKDYVDQALKLENKGDFTLLTRQLETNRDTNTYGYDPFVNSLAWGSLKDGRGTKINLAKGSFELYGDNNSKLIMNAGGGQIIFNSHLALIQSNNYKSYISYFIWKDLYVRNQGTEAIKGFNLSATYSNSYSFSDIFSSEIDIKKLKIKEDLINYCLNVAFGVHPNNNVNVNIFDPTTYGRFPEALYDSEDSSYYSKNLTGIKKFQKEVFSNKYVNGTRINLKDGSFELYGSDRSSFIMNAGQGSIVFTPQVAYLQSKNYDYDYKTEEAEKKTYLINKAGVKLDLTRGSFCLIGDENSSINLKVGGSGKESYLKLNNIIIENNKIKRENALSFYSEKLEGTTITEFQRTTLDNGSLSFSAKKTDTNTLEDGENLGNEIELKFTSSGINVTKGERFDFYNGVKRVRIFGSKYLLSVWNGSGKKYFSVSNTGIIRIGDKTLKAYIHDILDNSDDNFIDEDKVSVKSFKKRVQEAIQNTSSASNLEGEGLKKLIQNIVSNYSYSKSEHNSDYWSLSDRITELEKKSSN